MTLPETNIEWLWTLDLVELCGGNPALSAPQKQGLDAYRAAAIEAIVRALPMVWLQARRTVIEWHKEAATEIEARLD